MKKDAVVNVLHERTSEMIAGHKERRERFREKGRQGEVRHWSQEDRLQDFHYKKKVMDMRWMKM